jgi:hypothetical protein
MLFRTDEAKLSLAEAGRPWAFDAPGEEFKLAAEAYRINLAHLFDPMMAVHTSNVEPLAAPDHRRLRVHAAAPAPALRAGGRPRRRQNHHGRPLHPRTADAGRRQTRPHRRAPAVWSSSGRTKCSRSSACRSRCSPASRSSSRAAATPSTTSTCWLPASINSPAPKTCKKSCASRIGT